MENEIKKYKKCQLSWKEQELVAKCPGKWKCRNKLLLQQLLPLLTYDNEISFARYSEMPIPRNISQLVTITEKSEQPYDYIEGHWYVNFADAELFGYYGGTLLAQDELQVLEHPALASIRESLLKTGDQSSAPKTRDNSGATPVLVQGVRRRFALKYLASENDHHVDLYGNNFAQASFDVIKDCVVILSPPTLSNIVAIEAPKGHSGAYTMGTINLVLGTAYAAFRAIVLESNEKGSIVLHSGFWGCGAYGGNKVIMLILQMLAARLAGLSRLVLHVMQVDEPYQLACEYFEALVKESEGSVTKFLHLLEGKKLTWGLSNGT